MATEHNISFEELQQLAEGNLAEPRKSEVEKALQEDLNLQNTFEGIKAFMTNETQPIDEFVAEGKKKVSQVLSEHESTSNQNKPTSKELKTTYYLFAIAASIAALVFLFYPKGPQPQDFDFTDAGLPVTLGINYEAMAKAMNAYKLEDFSNAQTILENELNQNQGNDTLLYYLGVIKKEQKQYQKAISYFEKINLQSAFYQKTEYQLGLCYWYVGDLEVAKTYFEPIASKQDHLFQQKAKAALKNLN